MAFPVLGQAIIARAIDVSSSLLYQVDLIVEQFDKLVIVRNIDLGAIGLRPHAMFLNDPRMSGVGSGC